MGDTILEINSRKVREWTLAQVSPPLVYPVFPPSSPSIPFRPHPPAAPLLSSCKALHIFCSALLKQEGTAEQVRQEILGPVGKPLKLVLQSSGSTERREVQARLCFGVGCDSQGEKDIWRGSN